MAIPNASTSERSTVLVVEDETLIRLMLAYELESAGFHVVEVGNADDAMTKLLDDQTIGFVVTDVRMPGSIDGLGLVAWMREQAPGVPVIITSGLVLQPDAAALNPAIVRVVAKPYEVRDIATWLREAGCPSGLSAN